MSGSLLLSCGGLAAAAGLAGLDGLPGVTGVLVLEIPEGSALAKAGLRKHDVILSVNGTQAADVATLLQQAPALAPFHTLSLGIFRNQRESTLTIEP